MAVSDTPYKGGEVNPEIASKMAFRPNLTGFPSAVDLDAQMNELRIQEVTSGTSELNGAQLIMQERNRQIYSEEWDAPHDDMHQDGELPDAGISYALEAVRIIQRDPESRTHTALISMFWPEEWSEWWKPTADPIRNLVKAGALFAAEIDRLQRLEKKKARDKG